MKLFKKLNLFKNIESSDEEIQIQTTICSGEILCRTALDSWLDFRQLL